MEQDGMPSSPLRAAARRPSECAPLEISDDTIASGSGSGLGDMAPPRPPSQQVRRPTSRQTRRPSSSSLSQQDMASEGAGPSGPLTCERIKLSTTSDSATSAANDGDSRPSRRRLMSTSSKMVSSMSDHSPTRAERNESAMKDIIQALMVMSRRQPADVQDGREPQRPLTARTRLRLNRQHFESAVPTVSSSNSRKWPATAVASSSSTSLPVPPRTTRRKRASSAPLSPPLDHVSKRRRKTDRLSPSPSDSLAYNCQVTVACKTPPINLQSMRSLDARHVLQDPQIRHDGLFDSIGFLPASSFQPASVLPCSALAPQLVLEARIRDITSEMYWESVRAELRDGCRCTRWVVPKDASWPHGLAIDRRVKMRDCICGKWMTDKNEHQWVKAQHDNIYASRLPALFSTLRQIIESLMGSTTPAQTVSTSAANWSSAGPACTVAHPMVPHLLSVLDPEHLTLQVRRGADCTAAFELLGEAMKLHCAPVRDSIVEAMIQLARQGRAGAGSDSIAAALAKSFDCLEIMKLDIVNHQIRAMRPFLWREAPLNEMAAFHETLAIRGLTLQTSRTQAWIRSASERVLRRAPAAQRVHLLGKCTCARRSDFAAETMAEAFIDLVMADWTGDAAWPPSVHRRGKQPALDSGIGNVQLPEALQFDARRIRAFNAQTIDIAIQQAVLLGCRQIMRARTPELPANEIATRLALVQSDIRAAVAHTNAPLTAVLPDLTLHIAYRMAGVDPSSVAEDGAGRSLDDRLALDRLSVAVREMMSRDTSRNSPVLAACQSAVRRYLAVMLTHDLFAVRFDSQSTLYDVESALLTCDHQRQAAAAASAAATAPGASTPEGVHPARQARSVAAAGRAQKDAILSVYQQAEAAELSRLHLAPLKPQLHDLLRRMVDIACFNFAIFKHVYLAKGMMLGA